MLSRPIPSLRMVLIFFFSGSLSAHHHCVGIVAAPSARPYVSNFIGHDERIAQIDLHTSGHLTTLFSLYAPSTVPDPEDDLVRKESFWSKLDQIVTSHPKHKRFILAGDLNSRLHSGLDVAQEHIGPHHWGRPQSINDPQRDNAKYLHTSHVPLMHSSSNICAIRGPQADHIQRTDRA